MVWLSTGRTHEVLPMFQWQVDAVMACLGVDSSRWEWLAHIILLVIVVAFVTVVLLTVVPG